MIKIYNKNCRLALKSFSDNHFDTLITDPPYGLKFMGKNWDNGVPGVPFWKEFLRVCKPGAIALVFGGTRTYHRLACAIEDAGWEIRDCMIWLYGSGFPKSLDISKAIDKARGLEREKIGERQYVGGHIQRSKAPRFNGKDYNSGKEYIENEIRIVTAPATDLAKLWNGYGTALKPAFEPIIVAMKPLDGTFAHNAEKWGVGGLWIDGGRIGTETIKTFGKRNGTGNSLELSTYISPENYEGNIHQGRWPANLILDEEAGAMLDEQTGTLKSGDNCRRTKEGSFLEHGGLGKVGDIQTTYGDSGGASRFFYCAKSSKRERNAGLEGWSIFEWQNQNKEENMVAVTLLKKAISELTLTIDLQWSIGESGKSILALCPKDSLSIILTETKKTIESKIFHWLQPFGTNDTIVDVNRLKENGGSLVENAGNLSRWIAIITKGKTELVLGAKRVVSEMLSQISKKENWKPFTNFHSTVKPLALMEYLCKLTKTPTGGIVLDPFAGSGTTGLACIKTGRDCVMFEKSIPYFKIMEARIKGAKE